MHFLGCFTLMVALLLIADISVLAQESSILDPKDSTVRFDRIANNPSVPPYGKIYKWVASRTIKDWKTDSYKPYIYNGMPFRVKYPRSYNPHGDSSKTKKLYPLILTFHGAGEKGEAWENDFPLRWTGRDFLLAEKNGIFDGYLLFPQNQTGFWGDYLLTYVADIIQYMIQHNQVDPNRIIVCGLSSGGAAVWEFTNKYPELVAAASPVSSAFSRYGKMSSNILDIPFWIAQGGLDKNPSPTGAKYLVKDLQEKNCIVKYTEYAGQGHNCWEAHVANPDFFNFLNHADKLSPHLIKSADSAKEGKSLYTVRVQANLDGYQWKRDNTLLEGADKNYLNIKEPGVYAVRIKRGSIWSGWSPTPIKVTQVNL